MREFIRERFSEGDLAGVVAGSHMVNNRLTTVQEEQIAALDSVKPIADARNRQRELRQEWPRFMDEFEALQVAKGEREALGRVVGRACSQDSDACGRMWSPVEEIREKARRLTQAMQNATLDILNTIKALATGLARMAGTKTIVLLTEGFAAHELETTLRQVVGQTAQAGARVYAIDVRGLNRGRGAEIIDQQVVDDSFGGLPFDIVADGPNSLAVDTGGMMIRNENNIGRALDTIADDANRYYVIGYQPGDLNFDGRFRPVEVRVKRAGVRVRARRGYLALEPERMLTPRPVETTEVARTPNRLASNASVTVEAGALNAKPAESLESLRSSTVDRALRLRPDLKERVGRLEGGPSAVSALAERGWEAYQRGDVDAAVPLLQQAAVEPGVRPWVLYVLGWSQLALNRTSDATASWERVREAAPAFEPIYMDLADAYLQLSEISKALAVLREAARRWPGDPDVHNALGVVHLRRGELDAGIAAFARALAAAADEPLTYFNLGRAYEMRYSRTLRHLSSQRRAGTFSVEDRRKALAEDRRKALEYYEQHVRREGPYADQAREAIKRLERAPGGTGENDHP